MRTFITILSVLLTLQIGFGQQVMIFKPTSGANTGTDEGALEGGKDTWVNRYSPSDNHGSDIVALSSPRSNCNTSDYKSYFQFDVTTLPDAVDSVFFGVTHIPHTSYCYSNCNADFYFYNCASSWNEMTLTLSNAPTEEPNPFYGPVPISFPNDFGTREYEITEAYRQWKTQPNYGFTIYSPTVGCNNAAVGFHVPSSDDTSSYRPYLKIYYKFNSGIKNPNTAKSLMTYPNPFTNILRTEISHPDRAFLSDMMGRKYEIKFDPNIDGYNTNTLFPGLYFLQIENDGIVYISKVYKKH